MSRKILFVHQNFPAQFLHLAPELARQGYQVLALTSASNTRASDVETARYRLGDKSFPKVDWPFVAHFAEQSYRAEHVTAAAAKLKRGGYHPDVIFGHPGWGETLFLGEVWPDAKRLTYAEFFYRPKGLDAGFDPEFTKPSLRKDILVRSRQASQLLAMDATHLAVAPTRWQASTYPDHLQDRIRVIHDGIDTDRVRPAEDARVDLPEGAPSLGRQDEVLTFVSRNLEPYRGFHIFMRALPRILRERPNLQVVIVGGDGQSYGGPPPQHGTWKAWMLAEVGKEMDLSRVHFVGRIPYGSFLSLMQITRVHVYLTYPFVLSWSLLEAMSAGALVVASRTPPVQEVISDGENGWLVDFFDVQHWSEKVVECLVQSTRAEHIRSNARATVVEKYDLRQYCLPRQVELIQSLF
jgi:glycosyltransferase involved in cell wall biosynthesis